MCGTNQHAEKYSIGPPVRKVRATFMPCFPWTGVSRLPAGRQLMGADQLGVHARVSSVNDALDSRPVLCNRKVRTS